MTWDTFYRSCYAPLSPHRPKSSHYTAPISYTEGIYFGVSMQFGWGICLCYIVILLFIVCQCVFYFQLSWLNFIFVVAVDLKNKSVSSHPMCYLFVFKHFCYYSVIITTTIFLGTGLICLNYILFKSDFETYLIHLSRPLIIIKKNQI